MRGFSDPRALRRRLLAWFRRHRRELPWRTSVKSARHAYCVWVSEIMLQQTRVTAVLPYYRRFLRRFPTVQALARARTDEVLRYWAGLGYYRRARDLKAAASEIVRRYGGRFPDNYEQALALPGIGRYTAAAILSIAYEKPYAVLDGNVARVLARLACLDGDSERSSYRNKLQRFADELLPQQAPGDFNQALMELGATVCLPRRPLCEQCPVESMCRARQAGLEAAVPRKRQKPARVAVNLAVAVVAKDGKILLVRERGGFFSGLWQFPSARILDRDRMPEFLRDLLRGYGLPARVGLPIGEARHTMTHHDIRMHVFAAQLDGLPGKATPRTRWVSLARFDQLPVSSGTKKIARLYRESFVEAANRQVP